MPLHSPAAASHLARNSSMLSSCSIRLRRCLGRCSCCPVAFSSGIKGSDGATKLGGQSSCLEADGVRECATWISLDIDGNGFFGTGAFFDLALPFRSWVVVVAGCGAERFTAVFAAVFLPATTLTAGFANALIRVDIGSFLMLFVVTACWVNPERKDIPSATSALSFLLPRVVAPGSWLSRMIGALVREPSPWIS